MSNTRNESDPLPKGKKKSPLGKWFILKLLSLNNFGVGNGRNKGLLLTTVSNHKDYSQRRSEQKVLECDPSLGLRVNCDPSLASPAAGGIAMTPLWTGLLSKEQKDEWSVATTVDSSTTAWSIKIFLN